MQYPRRGGGRGPERRSRVIALMIKLVPAALLVPLACIGCAERQEPRPDPAKLEAFLAKLDAPEAAPGKTERLIASVGKIPPERINPQLAVAVVAK